MQLPQLIANVAHTYIQAYHKSTMAAHGGHRGVRMPVSITHYCGSMAAFGSYDEATPKISTFRPDYRFLIKRTAFEL
jgi:hypothetical protein